MCSTEHLSLHRFCQLVMGVFLLIFNVSSCLADVYCTKAEITALIKNETKENVSSKKKNIDELQIFQWTMPKYFTKLFEPTKIWKFKGILKIEWILMKKISWHCVGMYKNSIQAVGLRLMSIYCSGLNKTPTIHYAHSSDFLPIHCHQRNCVISIFDRFLWYCAQNKQCSTCLQMYSHDCACNLNWTI